MGMTAGVFLEKFEANDNGRLFDKIRAREHCVFLENGRFVIKQGHESSYFFVKSRKKGPPLDSLSP